MSRKKRLVAVGGLFVAVLVAAIVLVGLSHQANETSSAARSTATAVPGKRESPEPSGSAAKPSFTKANATMLERAMESRDKREQAKALEESWRTPYIESGTEMLPDGATITIDEKSFVVDATGRGKVNAAVSGSKQAEFVLVLVPDDRGKWLVYTTMRRK